MTQQRIEKLGLTDTLKRSNIEGVFPRRHIDLHEPFTIIEVRAYEKTQMLSFLVKRGQSYCRIRVYHPYLSRKHKPEDYIGAKLTKLGAMVIVNQFGKARSIIAEWIGTTLDNGVKSNIIQRNSNHYRIEKDQCWRVSKTEIDSVKMLEFDSFSEYLSRHHTENN